MYRNYDTLFSFTVIKGIMAQKSPISLSRKTHRALGLIIALALVAFAISGILLNHRSLLSHWDLAQEIMPTGFQYRHWNNGALRGAIQLNDHENLIYGATGIWKTDSNFTQFTDFNTGFLNGADNRKIFDLEKVNEHLYAATQSGLYVYDKGWKQLNKLGTHRFVGATSIGNQVFALDRSHLFIGQANGLQTDFKKVQLPRASNKNGKVSLFETIWQIHSGEIAGMAGRLFVDFLGIITLVLSATGITYFFAPRWIKKRGIRVSKRFKRMTAWSIRNHRKLGGSTFAVLMFLYLTGAFLRPPLLIPIAGIQVAPIPFSNLDQPNPWHDKLRDITYNPANGELMLATKIGLFRIDSKNFRISPCQHQPPISVMGINVLQPTGSGGAYMVGSFSGLYIWHPNKTEVFNLITRRNEMSGRRGPPIGSTKITGYLTGPQNRPYFVEYGAGALPLHHHTAFPKMPIFKGRISLWNAALEVHTARILSPLIGPFYILVIPLVAILSAIVCWSGHRIRGRKK